MSVNNLNMIHIKDLSFSFNTESGNLLVLNGISINIHRNEFVSILGPSGCGKTTFLRVIGNLNEDSDLQMVMGEITLDNKTPKLARIEYNIGFAFQDAVLLPWRKVIDNISLPEELIKSKHGELWSKVDLLKKLGLWDFRNTYPNELSGGMRQRLAIARTLIFKPSILLMDEPFGSLDASTREGLNIELLKIWQETNATVVFVTHSIPEAIFLSDRVITLTQRPAKIQHELKVDFERPRDIRIKETEKFIGYSKILREELEKARNTNEE